jgi:hypothetical protein
MNQFNLTWLRETLGITISTFLFVMGHKKKEMKIQHSWKYVLSEVILAAMTFDCVIRVQLIPV